MYKIKLTKLAHEDLMRICTYISQDLGNPSAALHVIALVEKVLDQLKSNPCMYEICRDPSFAQKRYRKAVIQNYVMIYSVENSRNEVIVLRIFHGSRNYTQFL